MENVLFLPLLISQEISFFGCRELKLWSHICKTCYIVTALRERFYLSYLTFLLKKWRIDKDSSVFSLYTESKSNEKRRRRKSAWSQWGKRYQRVFIESSEMYVLEPGSQSIWHSPSHLTVGSSSPCLCKPLFLFHKLF